MTRLFHAFAEPHGPPQCTRIQLQCALGVVVLCLGLMLADGTAGAQNATVTENQLPGTPPATWDISGIGDPSIQGFATDISYNRGDVARFKIKTNASAYTVDIYRLGYYQGNGARRVSAGVVTATLPQTQPTDLTDVATGLVDCGNWAESAHWSIPVNAVSGIYIARLKRTDTQGASHIVFIVRADSSRSDLLFQTSDATWQAYNSYGGNTLYIGNTSNPGGHASKVSYNRPMYLRAGGGGSAFVGDGLFNAEYPMVRWLEANGYDVSYTTNVDTDRRGALILRHKAFLSVAHDEYWSAGQRANVTAARNAGVHLAFFSGNEVYWKTRWEASIDGSGTAYRTLVCYKEGTLGDNSCGGKCDPVAATWTGLWRDGCSFTPPADGCVPENTLTGQMSWAVSNGTIRVPATYKYLRFWRNTSVAALTSGQHATLTPNSLGYEWDWEQYPDSYPAGRILLSETFLNGHTHHLSLYRHPSGALVFGAGTVQWSWGLDGVHERGGSIPSTDMRQATVNLFADMGVQPATLQPGLVPATASTDATAPVSTITYPASGAQLPENNTVTIMGTASDLSGAVAGVEVSVDGGTTWRPAVGTAGWTYTWTPTALGAATIKCRGFDDSGNMEQAGSPPVANAVSVNSVAPASPTYPCSIFPADAPAVGSVSNDGSGIEVGLKFRTTVDGYVTGVRFWKNAGDFGTYTGHLWSGAGTLLAEGPFAIDTTAGWKQAVFGTPVAIMAGQFYVASSHNPAGWYSETHPYFANAFVHAPLQVLADGEHGPNGIFAYSAIPVFPNQSFLATNYWVDVVFYAASSLGAPANDGPPAAFALYGGAPNPFTRSTVLAFDLPRAAQVRLEVFDVNGRRVRTLLSEPKSAGRHSVVWDGRDDRGSIAPAGVYLTRAQTGSLQTGVRRLVRLP